MSEPLFLDPARKVENMLCALLPVQESLAGVTLRWLPSGGPDGPLNDEQKQTLLIPPYVVVGVLIEDEILPGSDAYEMSGRIIVVSDLKATPPNLHSGWLARIKDALDALSAQTEQTPLVDHVHQVQISGFSIEGKWQRIADEENKSRVHVIPVAIGASG